MGDNEPKSHGITLQGTARPRLFMPPFRVSVNRFCCWFRKKLNYWYLSMIDRPDDDVAHGEFRRSVSEVRGKILAFLVVNSV